MENSKVNRLAGNVGGEISRALVTAGKKTLAKRYGDWRYGVYKEFHIKTKANHMSRK